MNDRTLCAAVHAKISEQIERTVHLIRLLPEDSPNWVPAIPGAWPVGILLGHLLDCLAGFCAVMYAAAPEHRAALSALRNLDVNRNCTPAPATNRIADYQSAFDDAFASISDPDLGARVPTVFVKEGEPLLTLLLGNLEHLVNHKHQLFTYLKMMGLSSADLYRFRA